MSTPHTVIYLFCIDTQLTKFCKIKEKPTMEFVKRKLGRTKHTARQIDQKDKSCLVLSTQIQRDHNLDIMYSSSTNLRDKQRMFVASLTISTSLTKRGTLAGISILFAAEHQKSIVTDTAVRMVVYLLATVNPEAGVVMSQDWKAFRSATLAELALPRIISNNIKSVFFV